MNQNKIEFENNILGGAWSKLLNHMHPQNIIHSLPGQKQKNVREAGRQKGRILFVLYC